VYVAGVASAVVARTSATFPSKKAWYSVTLIKSDAETRPRPTVNCTVCAEHHVVCWQFDKINVFYYSFSVLRILMFLTLTSY